MVVIGFARLFSDMGISNAIIYRQDNTRDELSSLYWINIGLGIIIFGIICIISPLIVSFYHEPRLNNLILMISFIFLITPFGQQFQVLLQRELNFNMLAIVTIIASVINTFTAIVMALYGMGVYSLIWGQLAGSFLHTLLLILWGCRNSRPSLHFSRRDLKGYLGFGLYQMGERSINYFNANLDYLIIGSLLGATSLGYYTLAYNLILKPLLMINPIITKVAFPVFSKLQNNATMLKTWYLKVLQLLSTVNFPILAGMAVVAPIAIPLALGEKWLPSVVLIQILSVVGILKSIGNPMGSLLLSKGRADLGFKWNAAVLIPQILGLYIGGTLGGAVGVAAAYALLMCIFSIAGYVILIRTLLGPCLREYISSMWSTFFITTIMGFIVLIIGVIFKSLPGHILLIAEILAGITVYLLLMIYKQKSLVMEIKEMVYRTKSYE